MRTSPAVSQLGGDLHRRPPAGASALLLIVIVVVAQFFCGMSSVTANSRMIYAFSRDGAVPGSKFWHHVSKKRRVPVRSAWFGAVGAFVISVPYMWNYTAYNAVVATAVIGLYIAYLTPVFLRRINPKAFVPGPYCAEQDGEHGHRLDRHRLGHLHLHHPAAARVLADHG